MRRPTLDLSKRRSCKPSTSSGLEMLSLIRQVEPNDVVRAETAVHPRRYLGPADPTHVQIGTLFQPTTIGSRQVWRKVTHSLALDFHANRVLVLGVAVVQDEDRVYDLSLFIQSVGTIYFRQIREVARNTNQVVIVTARTAKPDT